MSLHTSDPSSNTSSNSSFDWFLLDAYFAGTCSADDRATVEQWRATYPDRAARAHEMWLRRQRNRVDDAGRAIVVRQVMAVVGREAGAGVPRAVRSPRPEGMGLVKHALRAVTFGFATVALFLGLAIGGHLFQPVPTRVAVQRYTTRAGQYATVMLADGFHATLGPATTLDVRGNAPGRSASMRGAAMEVTVSGEALFTVTHHTNTPFIIQAGHATARVLGTTFMVRRYEEDRTTRVVVLDGRVALRNGSSRETVLSARTLAIVDSSDIRVIPGISIEESTAWMEGRLVFRNTPFREVLVELARVYGTSIRLADSTLIHVPVTWTVPTAELSLQDALDGLTTALNAQVARIHGVITIVPRRMPTLRDTVIHPSARLETQYGR